MDAPLLPARLSYATFSGDSLAVPRPTSPLSSRPSSLAVPPSPSVDLLLGNPQEPRARPVIHNVATHAWRDTLRLAGSVLPSVAFPAVLFTAWTAGWTYAYLILGWKIAIRPLPITVLSVVIGLLLVFRTNTAYDRYYEARRLWGLLFTHTRNLGRFMWITVVTKSHEDLMLKYAAVNLLLAYAVATKHYLRDEKGFYYDDLYHLMQHLPDFHPGASHPNLENLPLELSFHISSYITMCRTSEAIDLTVAGQMMTTLSALVDCLSNFERIRNSPIPKAYSVHLKQTLVFYLLLLPFQLLADLEWVTIPVVLLSAFTLLGIEAIGTEIENPFGYDPNDLDLDHFCYTIREELKQIIDRPTSLDPLQWTAPIQLSNYDRLVKVRKRSPSKNFRNADN